MTNEEVNERIFELCAKSEARIDRTNEMVCKLSDSTDKVITTLNMVTDKYTHHLDTLVRSRDEVIKQNSSLIEMLSQSQKMYQEAVSRYNTLLEHTFALFKLNPMAAANITVNQQAPQ